MGYPVEVDLTIIQGDDFQWEFEFEDENCEPINQGGEFYAQIRRKGVLLAEFDVTFVDNVVTLTLAAAYTASLPAVEAKWDLENHIGGLIITTIGGKIEIIEDVTDIEVS